MNISSLLSVCLLTDTIVLIQADTLAVVIPKEVRNTLKLKKGDKLKASLDPKKGFLTYKIVEIK